MAEGGSSVEHRALDALVRTGPAEGEFRFLRCRAVRSGVSRGQARPDGRDRVRLAGATRAPTRIPKVRSKFNERFNGGRRTVMWRAGAVACPADRRCQVATSVVAVVHARGKASARPGRDAWRRDSPVLVESCASACWRRPRSRNGRQSACGFRFARRPTSASPRDSFHEDYKSWVSRRCVIRVLFGLAPARVYETTSTRCSRKVVAATPLGGARAG